jgi:hypothetical protein
MEVDMNDLIVRRLEMSNRVVGFFEEIPIAFRKGSPGPQLVDQFKQTVSEIETLTATQVSEIAQTRAHSGSRGEARAALCEALDQISRTARGMTATIAGIQGRFQPVWGVGDSKLRTHARAYAENAEPYQKEFVNFEMAPDFLDDLNSKIEAFERAVAAHAAGRSAHVATSSLVEEAMQRAMGILVQLDPIVENKLKGNAALLLKWENIRHTERAWVSKKPAEPAAPAA